MSKPPTCMQIMPDKQLLLNGEPFFPIFISPGPDLGIKAPDGRDALEVLGEYGVNGCRVGMFDGKAWNDETEEHLPKYLDWLHRHGFHGAVNLRELAVIEDPAGPRAEHLKRFIERFKMHPAVAVWKTKDEPQWCKDSLVGVLNAYEIIHKLDPDHPAWMAHAPKGELSDLAAYCKGCDMTGGDIYPVSIPMGKHGDLPNRDISSVGDYARWFSKATDDKKPVWMVLQVTWSGVKDTKPALRPTPHQERFMIYDAIINGARGVWFFGSTSMLEGQDAELGFCWSYWQKVLGPIVKEFGVGSELYPVISAPEKQERILVKGAGDMEILARVVNGSLYILAARRDRAIEPVRSGFVLPEGWGSKIEVLYEDRELDYEPEGTRFYDYFWSFDVHVYKVSRM